MIKSQTSKVNGFKIFGECAKFIPPVCGRTTVKSQIKAWGSLVSNKGLGSLVPNKGLGRVYEGWMLAQDVQKGIVQ